MKACSRGQTPQLLQKYGAEISSDYTNRRTQNLAYRFQWPQRENQSLYDIAFAAVHSLTGGHCAYCDGHPIDGLGEDQIDHFHPKTWPEFYDLVCDWNNLFLSCSACNKAKLAQWEAALLRPDEQAFTFERYFIYRSDTGELEPNPGATNADKHRAQRTIVLLDLNRSGACINRRNAVKLIRAAQTQNELDDVGYHFLIPLCRAA